MIREITATGRDVNDAIEQGCAQLGISREDAQFEIISLAKKGFLGLKIIPAKVRVYHELPDPKPEPKPVPKPEPKPAPAPAPRAEQKPTPTPAPRAEQRPAPTPAAAPAAEQRPQQPRPQQPRPQQRPAPAAAPQRPQQPRPEREAVEDKPQVEITPTDVVRGKVEKAAVYLADIMRAMGFEGIEVTPRYYEENVCLQLSGAQMGVVIGRRGETLDALQYLTSLVANRGEGDYIRINIDSGNYREKREKTLTALARKLALQAVRTGKSTTLEPMNPYERRVIHGAVSQIRGATSTSVGADPNRRVVIACADPSKVRPERTGDRPQRTGPRPERTGPRPERTEPRPERAEARPERIETRPEPTADRPERTEPRPERTGDRPQRTGPRPERPGDRGGDRGGRGGHDRDRRGGRDRGDRPAPYVPDPNAERPKLSDADLFASIPTGVPVVSGEPRAPRPAQKPVEKPAPRKLDDVGTPGTYGKVE